MPITTRRGIFAGFGTWTSLMAAMACVFVIGSAVVAFQGWPGAALDTPPNTEPLVVADASVPPTAVEVIGAAAIDAASEVDPAAALPPALAAAAPDDGAVAATQTEGPASGPPVAGTGTEGTTTIRGTGSAGEDENLPPVLPTATPTTGDLLDEQVGVVVEAGSTLGDAVQTASTNLGVAVGGPLGQSVSDGGAALGETVASLERPIRDAADLVPPAGP